MQSKNIIALLLTLTLSTSETHVIAQDAGGISEYGETELNNDELPGIGSLFPVDELISNDESLGTDDVPSLGGSIPVDGGLSLLLAAGAAYGARRLRRRKYA
jgi:hypothetical protein